eukprot:XP_001694195.1 predicted protein [Chlamydomonas reinhardtii]
MAARGWPPLTVDGRKVAAYVTHLAELISRLPQGWEGIQLDSDALEEIQRFSSQPKLPPSILAALDNVPPGAYTIELCKLGGQSIAVLSTRAARYRARPPTGHI